MTTESNKASAQRFVDEVVNGGNLALIDELQAPDFVNHALQPGVPPNREGTKALIAMLRGAFPDLHATVDDVIAEGDKVVQRTTAHGTMKGEFAGMPPRASPRPGSRSTSFDSRTANRSSTGP